MNQSPESPFSSQPAKRGELARKLLKAATRAKRSKVPIPSLACDADQSIPEEAARVLGPYRNGQKWRLIVKEGKGRKSLVFDTREQAESVRATMLATFESRVGRTSGDALCEYIDYKRKRGLTERTLRDMRKCLSDLLPDEQQLGSITPRKAESLYAVHAERFAVATHQKDLRLVKAFYKYCVKQQFVTINPFANVQPLGKAKLGKSQLRTDEARKLSQVLLNRATDGDRFALALLVQVLLGLRSGEVLNLRKRDLDCGGKVLVIDGTKTKNAKRSLEMDAPAVRELLLHRCEGLAPEAFIFAAPQATKPQTPVSLWKALTRFCRLAGVPSVCPHSLRGLHSTLAVRAGATSTYVAQALGHGSDVVTRRHYIAPAALEAVRVARVAGALLGEADLDSLIETLRNLPSEQLDRVCVSIGFRR